MTEGKYYITTPIFYANATLHLGHTYTLVLADVLARYHRGLGDKTFFLTGADEHGDKIVRAAQKEGLGPQAFVDRNVSSAKEILSALDISNDIFIRTSDKELHWPGAKKLWSQLEASGDIYKGIYKGLYCVGCEAFITEKELVNGKCVLHDVPPEKIEEENYFFKLSKYSKEIKRRIESKEIKITPESRANEIISFISGTGDESELADVSISRPERDIPWGIPVPGDSSQVMYVWCDALSNYISALGYGRESDDSEKFDLYWPADIQILGKDILRFHVLLWPALLLSAELPLPREFLVHGFVNSGGKKMSKSLGNVLVPSDFISEYGKDALRYYLTREVSPFEDWDLTREKFKEVYNANLANGLGNLVSRTLKMSSQYFGGIVAGKLSDIPPVRTKNIALETPEEISGMNIPYVVINYILPRYHAHMKANEINKAADVIWELVSILDQFIADYEPFKLIKTDIDTTKSILVGLLFGLREISVMLLPMMPETSQKISELLGEMVTVEEDISFKTSMPSEALFMRKE